ncbi:hypothetical protein D0Z07_0207 [Hyphodiscus hymeniophilus]|uniref:Isochorismatase family protein family n=1 Tax=Hyphodiscus hymeniophilus TaxID=353542 RepID=A0A9P7B0Y4_9HELO|nr:hypothetical protein D0Z07_0207 [Hyphodiscus hymeniophilus]
MFQIDQNSLPFVRTRHALIAIDLQNDFISPNATIPVLHPPGLVDSITNLASNFRRSGNVIWIRTVFEASRPVNGDGTSESVITAAELPAARSGGDKPELKERPSQRLIERFAKLADSIGESSEKAAKAELQIDEEDQISEIFLTLEPGQIPHAVLPSSTGASFPDSVGRALDGNNDVVLQKTHYSAFKDGSLVQTLRAKFVTEIYLCGALTNISVYATAMDAARHGYVITIVDDCLGYRSKARHDEALRKLIESTGCDIVTSTDLISDIKERERTQRMASPLPSRYPRANKPSQEKDGNLDSLMASLNLTSDGSSIPRLSAAPTGQPRSVVEPYGISGSPTSIEQAEELKLPTRTPSTEVKRERVKNKVKTRRRHSKSGAKDAVVGEPSGASVGDKSSGAATSVASVATLQTSGKETLASSEKGVDTKNSEDQHIDISRASFESSNSLVNNDLPAKPRKGKEKEQISAGSLNIDDEIGKMSNSLVEDDLRGLCEGDTRIFHDLLDSDIAESIFERVRDEVRWQKMSHQGGDVPRLVAVQGEIGEDGSIPIYRHPADESPPLLSFTPVVSEIRKRVEQELGHAVNHVLIQFYRDGNDYISEHSDKTLDIVPKTFIANVSLGARRTMVFRTKKTQNFYDESQNSQTVQPRQATRAPLPHNSMCRMGLVTNMRWLHGIRQDKRMTSQKSFEELAFDGARISLTFRKIGTFLSKDQTRIWGQGATSKLKSHAETVVNGKDVESEKIIRAFGKENQASEFDWKEHYGQGFDVLHIGNSPKLFLTGDKVADLRVKLMLAEYGLEWSEAKLSPPFHWEGGTPLKDAPTIPDTVRFVDNDLSKSAVEGDLAIMLYLDVVYGSKSDAAAKSQLNVAKKFSRFQRCGELLKIWRDQPFSVKPFRKEMKLWDAFAAEAPFIAGETITLADYALWPLLEEIQTEWNTFDEFKNLTAYHKRLKQSSKFVKALSAEHKLSQTKLEKQPEAKVEKKPVQTDGGGKKEVNKGRKPNFKGKKVL